MSSAFVLPSSYDSLLSGFSMNNFSPKSSPHKSLPSSSSTNMICSPEVLSLYIQQQQLLQLQLACGTQLSSPTPCLCQSSSLCHPHLSNPGFLSSYPSLDSSHHSQMGLMYPQQLPGGNHPYFGQNSGMYNEIYGKSGIPNPHDSDYYNTNLPLLPLPIRLSKVSKNMNLASSLFEPKTSHETKSKKEKLTPSSPSENDKDKENNPSRSFGKDSPRSAFHVKISSPSKKKRHNLSISTSPSMTSQPSSSPSTPPPMSTTSVPSSSGSSYTSAFSPLPSSPTSVTSPCSPSSRSSPTTPMPTSPLMLSSLHSPSAAAAAAAVAAAVAAAQLSSRPNKNRTTGKKLNSNSNSNNSQQQTVTTPSITTTNSASSPLNRKKSVKHACTFPNCGNGFPTRFSLKRHMKRHTGERPFLCPWEENGIACGRKFGEKSTLKRHIRIHTGEKPFRCSFPTCGKLFADRVNRSRHELTHKRIDEP